MINVAPPMVVSPQVQPQHSQQPVTITELPALEPDRYPPGYGEHEQGVQTRAANPNNIFQDITKPPIGQAQHDSHVHQGHGIQEEGHQQHQLSPTQQQTNGPSAPHGIRSQQLQLHHDQSYQTQQQTVVTKSDQPQTWQEESTQGANKASASEPKIVVIGEDPPEPQGSQEVSAPHVENLVDNAVGGLESPDNKAAIVQEKNQFQNPPLQNQKESAVDEQQDKQQEVVENDNQEDPSGQQQAQLQQVKANQHVDGQRNSSQQTAVAPPEIEEQSVQSGSSQPHHEADNPQVKSEKVGDVKGVNLAPGDENQNEQHSIQPNPSSSGVQKETDQEADINQNHEQSTENVNEQWNLGTQKNIDIELQQQDGHKTETKTANENGPLESEKEGEDSQNGVVQDTCETQQEDNSEVQENQKIEMELKELREQLDHGCKISNQQTSQKGNENSQPKYKPVFGQQASSDKKADFAFETVGRSNNAEQSGTEMSASEQIPSVNEQANPMKVSNASEKQTDITSDTNQQRNVDQNRSDNKTESPANNESNASEQQEESPPIPLPDQETQKNIDIGGKGDGQSQQTENSVTPNNAGDAVQSDGAKPPKSTQVARNKTDKEGGGSGDGSASKDATKINEVDTKKSNADAKSDADAKENGADSKKEDADSQKTGTDSKKGNVDSQKSSAGHADTKKSDVDDKKTNASNQNGGSKKPDGEGAASLSDSGQGGKDREKKKLVELAAEHKGKGRSI